MGSGINTWVFSFFLYFFFNEPNPLCSLLFRWSFCIAGIQQQGHLLITISQGVQPVLQEEDSSTELLQHLFSLSLSGCDVVMGWTDPQLSLCCFLLCE